MPQLIDKESPELLFSMELEEALMTERTELSNEAQRYVVRLLSGTRQHLTRPVHGYSVSIRYLRAVQREPGSIRERVLRNVGDSALLLSGWWWRFTETVQSGPGVDYHVDLGWSAYRLIDGEPYSELADKFARLVDVLAQMTVRVRRNGVRTVSTTLDDVTLYDLYNYYCQTSSQQAERLLKKNGFDVRPDAKPQ